MPLHPEALRRGDDTADEGTSTNQISYSGTWNLAQGNQNDPRYLHNDHYADAKGASFSVRFVGPTTCVTVPLVVTTRLVRVRAASGHSTARPDTASSNASGEVTGVTCPPFPPLSTSNVPTLCADPFR